MDCLLEKMAYCTYPADDKGAEAIVTWSTFEAEDKILSLKLSREAKSVTVWQDDDILQLWTFEGAMAPWVFKQGASLLLAKKIKDTLYKCRVLVKGEERFQKCAYLYEIISAFYSDSGDTQTAAACTERILPLADSLIPYGSQDTLMCKSLLESCPVETKEPSSWDMLNLSDKQDGCFLDMDKTFLLKNNDPHSSPRNCHSEIELLESMSMQIAYPLFISKFSNHLLKYRDSVKGFQGTQLRNQERTKPQTLNGESIGDHSTVPIKCPKLHLRSKVSLQSLPCGLTVEEGGEEVVCVEKHVKTNIAQNQATRAEKSKLVLSRFSKEYKETTLSSLSDDILRQMLRQCLLDPQLPEIVSRIRHLIAHY